MYIGNDLQIAHPSYKIIDDISSGFNGSTTSFALQVSGATPVPFPISTQQVMISVNGVVQEPDPTGSAGFKLLGSNIVFSSAPANGHAFFGVINAGADYVTAGSEFPDGSATAPSFTFQDDQDTGWFRSGSGAVGYSANGVQTLTFDGNGLTVAAGKGLTVDTSTLKVDAANNRVGIGTASPSATLDLQGSANTDGVKIFGGSSGNNSPLKVGVTNGTEYFRVNNDGKVGIGVNAPAELLHLKTSSGNCKIRIDAAATPSIDFYEAGTRNSDIMVDHSSNELIISNRQAASINFRTDGANERMRLDSSGCLLVGTTARSTSGASNNALLTVAGNRASATGEGQLNLWKKAVPGVDDTLGQINFIGDGGDPGAVIKGEADLAWDQGGDTTDHPGRILFCTTADNAANVTERLRIDSKGDLMLGAVGQYNDITGHGGGLLIGPGTGSDSGIMLRSSSSGVGRIYFGDNSGSDNGRKDGFIVYSQTNRTLSLGTAQTERYLIGSAGQFGIAGANYGSSGQVLTSGGSGSAPSWTTISAAPEITATASGAIGAGKAVSMNSNGTVSEVSATFSATNPPTLISLLATNHDNHDLNDHVYDASSGYWVGAYRVTAFGHNKYQYNIYTSTSSGGSFQTVNNTAQMIGTGNNATNGRLVKLEDGKVLFCWSYNNGNAIHAKRGTIDSTNKTITWETCKETNSSGSESLDQHTPSENFDLAYIEDNKFMLVCRNPNANNAHAFVVTMNGLYWTKQHEVIINNTNQGQNCRVIWDSTNNCGVALYASGSGGRIRSCTLSGNTMTWGTESARFSPVTPEYQRLAYDKQADKYVVAWKDPGGSYSGQGRYCVASRSSNNMTVGTAAGFEANNINELSLSYNEETERMSLFWFRQSYAGRIAYGLTGSSTVAWSSPKNSGNYCRYINLHYDPVVKRSLVFYRSDASGQTTSIGRICAEMYNTGSLSSTSGSFVGFVDSAVSNGNSATIKVTGNTTTGQSGLTAGTKYYIGRSGGLVTTAETPEVVAGIALSSSSLLIKDS